MQLSHSGRILNLNNIARCFSFTKTVNMTTKYTWTTSGGALINFTLSVLFKEIHIKVACVGAPLLNRRSDLSLSFRVISRPDTT